MSATVGTAVGRDEFAGLSATVMGLGLFGGGAGTARFLAERGARVTVTDLRSEAELAESLSQLTGLDVRGVFGRHEPADFTHTDVVVANPAVPPDAPLLAAARAAGVRVTSEMAIFLERSPAPWVAVTGTQGKSSTATFTASLVRAGLARPPRSDAGRAREARRVWLGGNIGGSLLAQLDDIGERDVCVLELSSYQLEALALDPARPRRPALAVAITNVLVDHLARHKTLAAYLAAKLAIVDLAAQDAAVIVPADDPRLAARDWGARRLLRSGAPPAELALAGDSFELEGEHLGCASDLTVPGAFQRENALIALGLARALRVPAEQLAAALPDLRAPEHRMQDLGLFDGHRVWDNAVSTTPDSTLAALASLEGSCVCLLGGEDKGLAWDAVARELARLGARAVLFGRDPSRVAATLSACDVPVRLAPDVPSAVAAARQLLAPGEPLLFSPGCASFDAYRNFADRARAFRAALGPPDA